LMAKNTDRSKGKWRVVFTATSGGIYPKASTGPTYVASPESNLSYQCNCIQQDSEREARALARYLQRPEVAELVNKAKFQSASNSKTAFQKIPKEEDL